jgi:non-ribosomal peptide synthetase component F
MVIGLLGILKAGAAYVPFAPSQQQARLAFLFEDSQVGIVVARTGEEGQILGSAVKVVPVEIESIAALADEVDKAIAQGLKARTPILARRKELISSNREALLAQLNSLSTEEVDELLKQIQQGKLPKEL